MIFNKIIGNRLNPGGDRLLTDLFKGAKRKSSSNAQYRIDRISSLPETIYDVDNFPDSGLESVDISNAFQLLYWFKSIEPRIAPLLANEAGSGLRLRQWGRLMSAIGAMVGVALETRKTFSVPFDPSILRCCVDNKKIVG